MITEAEIETRLAPQDSDAEVCVLGSMFLDQTVIPDVREHVRAVDFYRPAHQVIFNTLCDMAGSSAMIDLVLLKDELAKRKKLDAIGGIDYLSAIAEGVPSSANAVYYAKIVKGKSDLRMLIQIGQRLTNESYAQKEDANELILNYQQRLYEIGQDGKLESSQSMSAGDAANAAIDRAEKVSNGKLKPGLMTGFANIDTPLGGIQKGDLVTLAAGTGFGKSSLALIISSTVAKAGGAVLYVSAEMAAMELGHRLIAQQSGIDSSRIKAGNISKEEWTEIELAASKIDSWNFELWGNTASVSEIASKARQLATKWQKPLSLVIVDYLQLMKPTEGDTKAQQIGNIAWGLKQLAMDLNTPVLMLSQLNREGAREALPSIHSLKESGDIENHSNVVLLLHRPEKLERDTDGALIYWAKIAKARDGRVTPWPSNGNEVNGAIKLRFKPSILRFEPEGR